MMGLLSSWRLWLAVALVAGVAGAGALGLHQARTIGELEADMGAQQAVIEGLGYQLNQQQREHEVALSARDAALEAERAHVRDAQNRAAGLSTEIAQARASDDEIDTCMGMPLPARIAERLRQ
tara:strand:+ start:418 stop:786 length:369 start_codon:yes stop_codon:yes gene_type:complete